MPDNPLRETLAEIKEAQYCPQQKIQGIVSHATFKPILHRAVAYLKPDPFHSSGLAHSRRIAISLTEALYRSSARARATQKQLRIKLAPTSRRSS